MEEVPSFHPDWRSHRWWGQLPLSLAPELLQFFMIQETCGHLARAVMMCPGPSLKVFPFLSMLKLPTQAFANTILAMNFYSQDKGTVVPSQFHS